MAGDVALVGAHYGGERTGCVYVFRYDGARWSEEQKLVPSDGSASDDFGVSVAPSEDFALIGATEARDAGNGPGTVYVYRYDGDVWVEDEQLKGSDRGDRFGQSISIDSGYFLVGSPNHSLDGAECHGAAYLFKDDLR